MAASQVLGDIMKIERFIGRHIFDLCFVALVVAPALMYGTAVLAAQNKGTASATNTSATSATEVVQGKDIPIVKTSPVIKKYKTTPTYAKRQKTYAKTWTNPETKLNYDHGHSLTIKMVKNPSDTEGTSHITKKSKTIKKTPDKSHPDWTCTTQNVSLNANSSSFLNNDYSDANSHIYPGAIFTFENFYHGQYKEQTGARNPMELDTDNPNIKGSSGVLVKDPSIVTTRDAIATLYHRMTGPAANESTAFQVYKSYTSSDLNIQISGGASGFGISFSDAFSSNSSSSSLSLTIDARKSVYSISALPPDNGFFTDASIENTPDLMVVSNVVYGVRVLANLTVDFNSSQQADEFKASYSGFDISANGAFDYLSKNSSSSSQANVYVVGGSGSSAITLNPKTLLSDINKILSTVTYENARPISYQFMNMAGDIVGAQSATDEFNTEACAPSTDNPKVTSVQVAFRSGSDGKDNDTNLNVYLYPHDFINQPNVDDMVGALYGYQSRGHSSAFGGGQTNYVWLTAGNGANMGPMYTRNDFINKLKGGHVRLHIYPNGNDTWDIQQMTLTFNFEDGTTKDVSFPPFVVSQDVTTYDVYFTGDKLAL